MAYKVLTHPLPVNLFQNLDVVKSQLEVSGKVIPFADLTLTQKFNAHHVMHVRVNYEALSSAGFMAQPEDVIELIGEKMSLLMHHTVKDTYNVFFGLVTDAVIEGTNGIDNNILLTCKSTSIRMDGKKAMDSFCDCDLSAIFHAARKNDAGYEDVILNPAFKEPIDYIAQYNETDFEFYNRLSYLYGEWFWFDGRKMHFGKPDPTGEEPLKLTYDKEMLDFRLRAHLEPARFNRYKYLVHEDENVSAYAPKEVPGLRGYLKKALDKCDWTYQAEGDIPCEAPVLSQEELKAVVRKERSRAVSSILTIEGTSRTCEVAIGKEIDVFMPYEELPIKQLETFLVTEVTHHIDEAGRYTNEFKGVIAGLEAVPMEPVPTPYAQPQTGVVYKNDDPDGKGRVQVQLQWQYARGYKHTNWIRVATPDAGSSKKVSSNRGYVFIPEIGDRVMVGFEYGDPNRPYVMSGIFSEKVGTGGGIDNAVKSIISRSGHTLEMNDDSNGWGITIKDNNGDIIYMDTFEESINITAPETININARNINSTASENITMNAGNNIESRATRNIESDAGVNVSMVSGEDTRIKTGQNLSQSVAQ